MSTLVERRALYLNRLVGGNLTIHLQMFEGTAELPILLSFLTQFSELFRFGGKFNERLE
jgi:hypothetical protein